MTGNTVVSGQKGQARIGSDGMDVSKCHGLTVRAIFATRRQNRFRREKTGRLRDTRGWVGWAGAGRTMGCIGMRRGGGGGGLWTPSYTLAARQDIRTDSIRSKRGLVAGRTGQARSDSIRPDQTDRLTSVMLTCALFVGRADERRLLPFPAPVAPTPS